MTVQGEAMTKLWTEEDIALSTLVSHLTDCGLSPIPLDNRQLQLRTASGIGFHITILEDKPFIYFGTYLPVAKSKTEEERLTFVHRLNSDIFLSVFSLDDDLDLTVRYVMSYQYGLIADQFTAMVQRFSSLLEYLVEKFDTNGMIDFGTATVSNDIENQCQSPLQPDPPLLH
jgi:hypothetical protein